VVGRQLCEGSLSVEIVRLRVCEGVPEGYVEIRIPYCWECWTPRAAALCAFGERLMRGKDFNTGLRGVLFERKHYERMGAAIWLYGWLVLRQTHQQGPVGWVLGGTPISYREIEEETGFNCRTIERWMGILRRYGYVETTAAPAGIAIRIMKAKKFPQPGRSFAEGARRFAGTIPQSRGVNARNYLLSQQDAAGIGSSSVEGSKEKTADIHRDFHSQAGNSKDQNLPSNPSGLSEEQSRSRKSHPTSSQQEGSFHREERGHLEARLRQQLLRAERDEAVRRELAVGTGPEVRRP